VNDTVGFVTISLERVDWYRLVGTIFLRRKHFRRETPERTWESHAVLGNQQLLYYARTLYQKVIPLENQSYLNAVAKIIKEARAKVRRRVRGAEIWLPPYGLDCLDFAKAHDDLKQQRKSS
jgi:hypothetical protein